MKLGNNQQELLNQHLNELSGRTMWHSIKNNLVHDIWEELDKILWDKVHRLFQTLDEFRMYGAR